MEYVLENAHGGGRHGIIPLRRRDGAHNDRSSDVLHPTEQGLDVVDKKSKVKTHAILI